MIAKYIQWFIIFKKLQNWKSLNILLNIQAILTRGIIGEETASSSNFNSVPFYELCLKITSYSINEVFLLRMREEYASLDILLNI